MWMGRCRRDRSRRGWKRWFEVMRQMYVWPRRVSSTFHAFCEYQNVSTACGFQLWMDCCSPRRRVPFASARRTAPTRRRPRPRHATPSPRGQTTPTPEPDSAPYPVTGRCPPQSRTTFVPEGTRRPVPPHTDHRRPGCQQHHSAGARACVPGPLQVQDIAGSRSRPRRHGGSSSPPKVRSPASSSTASGPNADLISPKSPGRRSTRRPSPRR